MNKVVNEHRGRGHLLTAHLQTDKYPLQVLANDLQLLGSDRLKRVQVVDDVIKVLVVSFHRADVPNEGVQRVSQLVTDSCVDEREQRLLGLDLVVEHLRRDVDNLNHEL